MGTPRLPAAAGNPETGAAPDAESVLPAAGSGYSFDGESARYQTSDQRNLEGSFA
jgi:hypothetical protein